MKVGHVGVDVIQDNVIYLSMIGRNKLIVSIANSS